MITQPFPTFLKNFTNMNKSSIIGYDYILWYPHYKTNKSIKSFGKVTMSFAVLLILLFKVYYTI